MTRWCAGEPGSVAGKVDSNGFDARPGGCGAEASQACPELLLLLRQLLLQVQPFRLRMQRSSAPWFQSNDK